LATQNRMGLTRDWVSRVPFLSNSVISIID
jgi:hypothetical protein